MMSNSCMFKQRSFKHVTGAKQSDTARHRGVGFLVRLSAMGGIVEEVAS